MTLQPPPPPRSSHAGAEVPRPPRGPVASTLLVAWSAAATLVPLAVTALTPVFGEKTFIHAVIAVALAYAAFVAHRLRRRETVPPEARETFEIRSAQVPNAGALVEGERAPE